MTSQTQTGLLVSGQLVKLTHRRDLDSSFWPSYNNSNMQFDVLTKLILPQLLMKNVIFFSTFAQFTTTMWDSS